MTEKKILNFFLYLFIFANILLFALRELDKEWWFADYQIYSTTSGYVHFAAIFNFIFYVFSYYLIAALVLSRSSTTLVRKNLPNVFFTLVILYIVQICLALFEGIGIAGGVGVAPAWALPFLIFSVDGLFFAYALTEINKKRLFCSAVLFVLSNVVRGWAGFIVPAALLYIVRRGGIARKSLVLMFVMGILVVPILFVVRDYFRGGYSHFQLLVDSGFVGFLLLYEYIDVALKLMLSRLDLYSHYIGVYENFKSGIPPEACNPIIENIIAKIILYFQGGFDCKPLGGVLPGVLYEFFQDKGTSYSISSGFLALPILDAVLYFIPYIFSALLTCIIFFRVIQIREYSIFAIFFIILLLVQGWMYQFYYNILGLLIGVFLIRLKFVAGK